MTEEQKDVVGQAGAEDALEDDELADVSAGQAYPYLDFIVRDQGG